MMPYWFKLLPDMPAHLPFRVSRSNAARSNWYSRCLQVKPAQQVRDLQSHRVDTSGLFVAVAMASDITIRTSQIDFL